MASLEEVLDKFFSNCLAPGKAFGSREGAFTDAPQGSKLRYQDSVSNSCYYALSDVYEHKDGTFTVQTLGKCGGTECNSENGDIIVKKCATLLDVFNVLSQYNGMDLSTCGELVAYLAPSDINSFEKIYKFIEKFNIISIKDNQVALDKIQDFTRNFTAFDSTPDDSISLDSTSPDTTTPV